MRPSSCAYVILCCAVPLMLLAACGNDKPVAPEALNADGGALGSVPGAADTGDTPVQPSATDIREVQFDDPEFPLRRRIRGLLDAYAGSCEDRDIGSYGQCLQDGFRFVFLPEDAEWLGLPPAEPWWYKPEDLAAMGGLFEASDVVSIQFDFLIVPERLAMDPASTVVGIRIEPDIKVLVEPGGSEPLLLWVNYTYLDLTLVREPDNLWVIEQMQEVYKNGQSGGRQGIGGVASEPLTFGRLKSIFR